MSKAKVTKIRMNSKTVGDLLKSASVQADIAGRARRIEAAMPTGNGEEWATSAFVGHDRAQAMVRTTNTPARKTAARKPAEVIGALGAGR